MTWEGAANNNYDGHGTPVYLDGNTNVDSYIAGLKLLKFRSASELHNI